MKTRSILSSAFGLVVTALPLAADVFILTDGTRLEGSILSDEGDSYLLEIQVTPSIKDERTVAKADIRKIEAERTDLKAFAGIENLVPIPDLLTREDYAKRVAAVKAFLKEHPKSLKARAAQGILATLEEEAALIAGGGVKIDGSIVSAEEYNNDAYEIDSRVLESRIREASAQGNIPVALRLLGEMGQDFGSTAAFRDLQPIARQLLQAHMNQTQSLIASLPEREKERKAGLQTMSPESRASTLQAIKEEHAALDARLAREKAAGREAWVSTHPFHAESLRESLRVSQEMLRRLSAPQSMPDGGDAYRETMAAVKEGAPSVEINAAYSRVTSAQVPERYIDLLKQAVKESKAKAEKEAAEKEAAGEEEASADVPSVEAP